MTQRRSGTPSSTDRVHTITSTQGSLTDDIDRRARRYLLQMSLRTVCFLGAVLTWGRVPTAVSVTLLVGAVVLPYVAVVLANAGRERPERADSFLDHRAIAAGPATAPPADTGTVRPPTRSRRTAPGSPTAGSRPGATGPTWQTRPTDRPSRPAPAAGTREPVRPGEPAGRTTDDTTWAHTEWTDPPWDDPQWREARTEDPTGTPPEGGSGRG